MKAKLEILLAQIDEQMAVMEEQLKPFGYLNKPGQAEVTLEGWTVYQARLADGSYPLVPLLAAKAQILHALTMIQMTEVT